ncbi:MAG: pantetheine-phosphate adenylyltransferase [Verrucomicrobia bacterium]|nr:pantetheine-phosphate adenylyltransferase [Verrucomicrobiota bacterium]
MNRAAIYAGTFDPITLGHLDVVERAARIFNRLIIAVTASTRKETLFTVEERRALVAEAVKPFSNVEVDTFDGLLVQYARAKGVCVLVRGLRAFSDFEVEFQMALTNRKMAPDIETLFLMPKEDYSYVSSSTVREIAQYGGDMRDFVTEPVQRALKAKLAGGTGRPKSKVPSPKS